MAAQVGSVINGSIIRNWPCPPPLRAAATFGSFPRTFLKENKRMENHKRPWVLFFGKLELDVFLVTHGGLVALRRIVTGSMDPVYVPLSPMAVDF